MNQNKPRMLVALASVVLTFTGPVTAQNFHTIYNFTDTSGAYPGPMTNSDGSRPQGNLVLSGSTLYGTTMEGGNCGNGTVFAVNVNGSNFCVLHHFTTNSSPNFGTNSDGANPKAGLVLSGTTLYGTTAGGGTSGYGTIFAVSTDGTGFTNLHNFAPSVGSIPYSKLLLSGNTLYGTTEFGPDSTGSVFALNTDGTGFRTVHAFFGSDGATPYGGLAILGNTLYGTTREGGTWGYGNVFAVNTDGTGFKKLHDFEDGTNGDAPTGDLIISGNVLYGTSSGWDGRGDGTVFAINTDGTDSRTSIVSMVATKGGIHMVV